MANDLNRSIKVYIDNSDAMANAQKLENKISQLRAELQRLNAEGKNNTKDYASQEKALKKLERSYGNYQNQIQETQRVLKNLSGATYTELERTRKILIRDLKQETRGTEQHTEKLKNLTAVQKELNIAKQEMNGTMGSQNTLLSRAANGFNKYFGMFTGAIAAVTGFSFALRKLSQDAAEMDDVYSDVMKTTGNTKEEVLELNEVFKDMDTRTSREQLNMLARDAGKLGLSSRKDILDFVESANQIQVALGEDLGEGAIREVGKMVDVFTKSTEELENLDLKQKMLAVGSAINEIGASSSAQEDYLVQFAGRLGGVATQAGIGIDAILGYASVLDQDMQQVEMSATALQQVIIKMMGDPAKFARLAGVEVSQFARLVRTDANEAIKVLLRSLNERGGFQELVPLFDEMGLSGTRAVGVISSLAGSIDKIDAAQALANKSIIEGTSLTNEYNIKNNNAAATLEKRKKAFQDSAEELGQRLNPAMLKSTNILTYIVKLLPVVLDFLGKYGRYIVYLATAYATYAITTKAAIAWETKWKMSLSASNIMLKTKTLLMTAAKVATLAYNVVIALLTGNITRMRAAWKLMNAAMATNPIGLIAVAATAAVAGIVKLVQWLNRTSTAAKAVKEATKQFNSEIATETREANDLFAALKRANPESNTFLQIRKEIISKYGSYLQGLVDEKGNITDIGKAVIAVNNGIRQQIALKIKNQAADKIQTDSLDKQIDLTDKVMGRIGKQVDSESVLSSIRETINRTITEFTAKGGNDYNELQRTLLSDIQNTYGVDAYKGVFNVKNVVADLVNEVRNSETALDEVDKKFSGIISKYTNVNTIIDLEKPDPLGGGKPDGNKEDVYAEALKKLDKYIAEETAALQWKYTNGLISQEQYNRELEYLEMERLRKNLQLSGLTFEQQQEIELKLFETKKQMLQKIEDEEKEHQRKLLEIQTAADKARAEKNNATLKAIAKQNEVDAKKRFESENKRKSDLVSLGMDFANEMGTMVGGAVSGNEDIVASSLKSIINMALDVLKLQVQMSVAGATAQSLAQPDSVATFGASGLARAAVLVGLIEAAFAAVKAVVGSAIGNIGNKKSGKSDASGESITGSRVVSQRAAGKYDVIGAYDGRSYPGVPYVGLAQTGFVSTPTLMGEQGRELVVSAPDLVRLQRHINYPLIISAINEARGGFVPQRAAGNYSQVDQPGKANVALDPATIHRMNQLLEHLATKGVLSTVLLSEFERKQYIQESSRKIGRK